MGFTSSKALDRIFKHCALTSPWPSDIITIAFFNFQGNLHQRTFLLPPEPTARQNANFSRNCHAPLRGLGNEANGVFFSSREVPLLSIFGSKGGTICIMGVAGIRRLDFNVGGHTVITFTIIVTTANHTFYAFQTIIPAGHSSLHMSTSFTGKSFFSIKSLSTGYSVIIQKLI
jgi:hypothetical protein